MAITRRKLLTTMVLSVPPIAAALSSPSAQEEYLEIESEEEVPFLVGRADFSGAWERIDDGQVVADFVSRTLQPRHHAILSQTIVRGSGDINEIFARRTGLSFLDWVTRDLAKSRSWSSLSLDNSSNAHRNFNAFWDIHCANRDVSMLEFFAYTSSFTNEVGTNLVAKTERINGLRTKNNPGISYLFNQFYIRTKSGRTFRKASYNGGANRSCYSLFNDKLFVDTFADRQFADDLRYTRDPVWNGTQYPIQRYPASPDPSITGIIVECDFFKFRGRGIIQTTWRSNYKKLVEFIQANSSQSDLVRKYNSLWGKMSAENALTMSSNDDWDDLFGDEKRVILTHAVRLHAESNDYLPLSSDVSVANSSRPGSLIHFGRRIGGDATYGHHLRERVVSMSDAFFG